MGVGVTTPARLAPRFQGDRTPYPSTIKLVGPSLMFNSELRVRHTRAFKLGSSAGWYGSANPSASRVLLTSMSPAFTLARVRL